MRVFLLFSLITFTVCTVHAWSEQDLVNASKECSGKELRFLLNEPDFKVNERIGLDPWKGYTPLLIAVQQGCPENVARLLIAGADTSIRLSEGGKSALDIAYDHGRSEIRHAQINGMIKGAVECDRLELELRKSQTRKPTENFKRVCRSGKIDIAISNGGSRSIEDLCRKYCEGISSEQNLKPNIAVRHVIPCTELCVRRSSPK